LKVTYTEEAVADIVEAITYLNERNLTAAENLDAEIARCIGYDGLQGPSWVGGAPAPPNLPQYNWSLLHMTEALIGACRHQDTDKKRTVAPRVQPNCLDGARRVASTRALSAVSLKLGTIQGQARRIQGQARRAHCLRA
jgi:plasmid stabilization system protein ParE